MRRGKPRRNALARFKILLNNIRGYKTKEAMLKRIVAEEEPVIMAVVETKLNDDDVVEIPGYLVKRVNRDEDGGGVLMMYRKCLKKILVVTAEIKIHNAEMLWSKLDNCGVKTKIGVIYMPQESRTTVPQLKEVYQEIEKEVADAQQSGESIIIMGDMNCKVGDAIKGNIEVVTTGGRLLTKLLKKYKLKMVNADCCCEGLWTRIEGASRSVLDYVIVFEDDIHLVEKMQIDEEKDITPYYVEKCGGEVIRQYTDHCMITTMMKMNCQVERSRTYAMVLDEKGYQKFKEKLEEEKVSKILEEGDIRQTYPEWSKKVMELKKSCSKRVKIQKKWKVCRKLTAVKRRITRQLKKTNDKEEIRKLRERKNIIKQQIEEEEHKKENARINKIVEEIKKGGGVNSNTFWEVRRKLCGRPDEKAHAMMNREGKMCEEPEEIKKIYMEWFQELLTTREGESKTEKQAEEIVEMVWKSMEAIAKKQPPRITSREEVQDIVKKLDPKKAKDEDSWKNDIIKEGGEEMISSITNIVNAVDSQRVIPHEWQRMQIKATHKAGPRYQMSNKRGLFLTNNVSKVYERVVKERNKENFINGITEWQTGGVNNRAPVDNVMTTTAIIEQNNYLKKNTYLVFTDAEKCFDKLWLKDGINELWRCGTDVRDCVMIKKLNEKAEITVQTPVGNTEPFQLNEIVRQGSVYGPQICIASMDKINLMGKDIRTHYSPDLAIQAVVFVDDVTGAGGVHQINNTIYNCSMMEERKKMTFNNKRGKTEYMIVGKAKKEEIRTVSKRVKKGVISRVNEHKLLGTWIDEDGSYEVNIEKKKEKLPYMLSTTKRQASPKTIGRYTMEARLKLAEAVILQSILVNVEGFPYFKNAEIKQLESVQLSILTNLLELPKTTPYCALLMEVGWWPMKDRLSYKKLMLYHNIVRSDDRRVIKKILSAQEREVRPTTWLAAVERDIRKYKIQLNAKETLKSTWKREVKRRINEEVELELRQKCNNSAKARIVKEDKFERKGYLQGKVDTKTAKKILLARLNMCKLPANYKQDGKGTCHLCEEGEGTTEHYFRCVQVNRLKKVCGVKVEHLMSQDMMEMRNVANFLEKVEIMLEPGMKKWNF